MKVNKTLIKDKLIEEAKSLEVIERLLEFYPDELDDRLEPIFLKYIEDGTVLEFEFDEIKLTDIVEIRKEHFFVALRDMSKLMSTAEGSEDRAKWKKILTRPVFYE